MIYCIWYPSGGFGHFINAVLTLHGKEFIRPTNKIKFSKTGDSHSLNLTAPLYTKNTVDYYHNFDPNYNHSVLVDLGINSDSRDFTQQLPESEIIKMCYTDTSWPIISKTMIDKAMKSTIESELAVDPGLWDSTALWAQREKYFLFLRDHNLRHAWRCEAGVHCVFIDSMINYAKLKSAIECAGIKLSNFEDLWNEWYVHNKRYFAPVAKAQQVLDKIETLENINLTNITDVWTQAVIYYFIWLRFNKEVPHNEFEDFFEDTDQIRSWLRR